MHIYVSVKVSLTCCGETDIKNDIIWMIIFYTNNPVPVPGHVNVLLE